MITVPDFKKRKIGAYPAGFGPIIQRSVTNYLNQGKAALTGPLVRQDDAVVQKHLNALNHGSFKKIYQAFVDLYKNLTPKNRTHHDHCA